MGLGFERKAARLRFRLIPLGKRNLSSTSKNKTNAKKNKITPRTRIPPNSDQKILTKSSWSVQDVGDQLGPTVSNLSPAAPSAGGWPTSLQEGPRC